MTPADKEVFNLTCRARLRMMNAECDSHELF